MPLTATIAPAGEQPRGRARSLAEPRTIRRRVRRSAASGPHVGHATGCGVKAAVGRILVFARGTRAHNGHSRITVRARS